MTGYNSIKYFPIKLFSFLYLYSYIISLPCDDYFSCFDCISNYTCIWSAATCKIKNDILDSKYNININNKNSPKKCLEQKDIKTINYIQTYCGNLFYYFKENGETLLISLPVHNQSFYGANNLYCEYTIYNKDLIESFTIQTSKNWGSLKMHIKDFYSSKIKEYVLGDGDKNILNKCEEIKIIFESNLQNNINPFTIIIMDTFSPINKIIISAIISFSCIGIIIIVIVLICWYKKRKRNRFVRSDGVDNLNNIYINNINIINNNTSTDRIGLKNYLNRMKAIKFEEIEKNIKDLNNIKCPIDMENFEQDSDVILTECFHVFHYDCLKTYIEKNHKLKELRCPLCNHILYSTQIRKENDSNINSINDNK